MESSDSICISTINDFHRFLSVCFAISSVLQHQFSLLRVPTGTGSQELCSPVKPDTFPKHRPIKQTSTNVTKQHRGRGWLFALKFRDWHIRNTEFPTTRGSDGLKVWLCGSDTLRHVLWPSLEERAGSISARWLRRIPAGVAERGLRLPAAPPPPGHGGGSIRARTIPALQLLPPLRPRGVPHRLSEESRVFLPETLAGHTLHVFTFTSCFLLRDQTQETERRAPEVMFIPETPNGVTQFHNCTFPWINRVFHEVFIFHTYLSGKKDALL